MDGTAKARFLSEPAMKPARYQVACAALLAFIMGAHPLNAADPPSLFWKVEPPAGVQGSNGLTFEVFSPGSGFELRFSFVNDESDAPLIMGARFLRALRVTLRAGTQPVATTLRWETATVMGDGEPIRVGLDHEVIVPPDGRLEAVAVIERDGAQEFDLGNHSLDVNIQSAVRLLTTIEGAPWRGRYVPEGALSLRLAIARTAQERLSQFLVLGNRASENDDPNGALQYYRAALRVAPTDGNARMGAGRAYLDLGRFREAATEFEPVMASVMEIGEHSPVYMLLAYAYVALGEEQRARAVLARTHAASEIDREIQHLRREARRAPRPR